jgi:regulator of protease activity HflC (stomatin/prohibitin superfamily)
MQQQQQVEMDVDAVTAVETAEAQEEEYLLGAKGASALRQLLSKSGNPAAVIAQFQSQHVVKAVHIDPMLQYFDLMGITRLEVHTQIMQALREKLAGKIPTLAMAV